MSNDSKKSSPTLQEPDVWSADDEDFADQNSEAVKASRGHRQVLNARHGYRFGHQDVLHHESISGLFQGWPDLVTCIAKNPEFAALDRFDDLNIKSLLYYQAELDQLREKLKKVEMDDVHNSKDYYTCTNALLASRRDTGDGAHLQWDLIQDIRKVLREYNAALLQYSQVATLPAPESINVKTLRRLIQESDNAGPDCVISGFGSDTWGQCENTSTSRKDLGQMLWNLIWPSPKHEIAGHLVAIHPTKKVDGLTRWIAQDWVPFYHEVKLACKSIYTEAQQPRPKEDAEQGVSSCSASGISYPSSEDTGDSEKPSLLHRLLCGLLRLIFNVYNAIKQLLPKAQPECNEKKIDLDNYENNTTSASSSTNSPVSPIERYSLYKMVQFTSAFATIVACLLPTAAIAILSKIHQIEHMLIAIAALTATFAVGLLWMTTPGTSRIEIFTGAATFSAVLVVFVQNQLQVTTNDSP